MVEPAPILQAAAEEHDWVPALHREMMETCQELHLPLMRHRGELIHGHRPHARELTL